jgi:acetone carboxylase gamma subunit
MWSMGLDDRSEVNVEEEQERMREIGPKHTISGLIWMMDLTIGAR